MSKRTFLLFALLIFAALIILPNWRALYEGVFFYLRDVIAYNPNAITPISPTGRYASLYDLIRFRNAERLLYLQHKLTLPNIIITPIPIPNSDFPSIFVRFNQTTTPYTIYSAHYDKLFDDPDYQGASDNTAAVSVMLAAIQALATDGGNRAFLFTGEEEKGLRGSSAFMDYARANNLPIKEIINFDNLGRGKLAIRPSAPIPGFVFAIPFVSDYAFDGRALRASPAYPLANARLTRDLLRAQPDLVVYERFTALSDSNVFQDNGIATVAISGDDMYYLEQTWHTYADRAELLDERNLDRAFNLILNYP